MFFERKVTQMFRVLSVEYPSARNLKFFCLTVGLTSMSRANSSRQTNVFMLSERYVKKDARKALVLPNITYPLAVYGAAEPELTTAQQFLDICYNRKYISKKLSIYQLLEKQDKKIFKKASFLSSHPLHTNLPKTKQVTYSLRSKSSARSLINTNRCKHTFINRLTFNDNLTV